MRAPFLDAWRSSLKRLVARTKLPTVIDGQGTPPCDLLELQASECVRVEGSGTSIQRIHARITNRLGRPLRAAIRPGTYFVAAGGCQDMVVIDEHVVDLPPHETVDVPLPVACMRALRPVPHLEDTFACAASAPADITRFLRAAQGLDPMSVQAGVWTLSDRFSRAQVQQRLHRREADGRITPAITDAHVNEAQKLLDRLGILHFLAAITPPGGRGGGSGESAPASQARPSLVVPRRRVGREETFPVPPAIPGPRPPSQGAHAARGRHPDP